MAPTTTSNETPSQKGVKRQRKAKKANARNVMEIDNDAATSESSSISDTAVDSDCEESIGAWKMRFCALHNKYLELDKTIKDLLQERAELRAQLEAQRQPQTHQQQAQQHQQQQLQHQPQQLQQQQLHQPQQQQQQKGQQQQKQQPQQQLPQQQKQQLQQQLPQQQKQQLQQQLPQQQLREQQQQKHQNQHQQPQQQQKQQPHQGQQRPPQESQQTTSSKVNKPPPLIAYNVPAKSTITQINSLLGHDKFTLKRVNNNVKQIATNSVDDFKKVSNLLKNENIAYYTFTPSTEKPHNLVLRGIDPTFDCEEVRLALNEHLPDVNAVKVTFYKTSNLRLVQLHPNSNLTSFFSLKHLLHQRVSVEKIKTKQIVQCYNCQRLGHAATNCNMPFRCLICSGTHPRGQCPIPTKDSPPHIITQINPNGELVTTQVVVKCPLCQGAHTAKYGGCPKKKELKQRMAERKAEARHKQEESRLRNMEKNHMFQNFRQSGVSYASLLAGPTKPTAPQAPQNNLLGLNIADYTAQLQGILPQLQGSDQLQKQINLLALITNYVLSHHG